MHKYSQSKAERNTRKSRVLQQTRFPRKQNSNTTLERSGTGSGVSAEMEVVCSESENEEGSSAPRSSGRGPALGTVGARGAGTLRDVARPRSAPAFLGFCACPALPGGCGFEPQPARARAARVCCGACGRGRLACARRTCMCAWACAHVRARPRVQNPASVCTDNTEGQWPQGWRSGLGGHVGRFGSARE